MGEDYTYTDVDGDSVRIKPRKWAPDEALLSIRTYGIWNTVNVPKDEGMKLAEAILKATGNDSAADLPEVTVRDGKVFFDDRFFVTVQTLLEDENGLISSLAWHQKAVRECTAVLEWRKSRSSRYEAEVSAGVDRYSDAALRGLRKYNEESGTDFKSWDEADRGFQTIKHWIDLAEQTTALAKRQEAVMKDLGSQFSYEELNPTHPTRKAVDWIIKLQDGN